MANNISHKVWKSGRLLVCLPLALLLVSCSKPLFRKADNPSPEGTAGAPVVEASYPVEATEPAMPADPQVAEHVPETVADSPQLPAAIPDPDPIAVEPEPEPEPESAPEPEPIPEPEPQPKPESEPETIVEPTVPAEEPESYVQPPPAPAEPAEVETAPVESTPPEATLNLDKLGTRLRKTKAIGLFTKLELKSQVEDLLDEMEDYHDAKGSLELDQLEEHFNLLVMKLLLLLQDDDPQLHKEIARSRPVLWTTLADPNQFSSMKGT